ncbi:MerR family transcriptional regulator [Piscirickettsia litoralis]|uniref:Helix-turn-helix domain-containing protein n=1 Tax=Piscirickettsia litoralis TaxID=1891921 RepID=A0ABX3A129_9GAMM|nr:hypothetical protein [Piscirickettsia litoralis]ODN41333.1 hypothetical protein BGC07_16310 [Piscirickettsia litoralis]
MKYILASDYAKLNKMAEPEVYELVNQNKLQSKHFGSYRRPLFIAVESVPKNIISLDAEANYFLLRNASKKLGVSPERIREIFKAGLIKPIRTKGFVLIDEDQLFSEEVAKFLGRYD